VLFGLPAGCERVVERLFGQVIGFQLGLFVVHFRDHQEGQDRIHRDLKDQGSGRALVCVIHQVVGNDPSERNTTQQNTEKIGGQM